MKRLIIYGALIISVIVNVYFISRRIYVTYIYKPPVQKTPPHIPPSFRTELFKLLPIEPNEVLFIGDSHIEHLELQEIFRSCLVKNRGISGNTTQMLMDRIGEITKRKPAKIFIEIGVNDLLREIPTDTILYNFSRIIKAIKTNSPNTQMFIISLLPTKWNSFFKEVPITQSIPIVNKQLKQLAITSGIPFINMFGTFEKNNGLNPAYDSGDGIHLSASGVIKFCNILSPYISN